VARVPRSSTRASDLNSLGTNDASHVPIQCLIQCNYCTDSFKSISVLESHLQRAHKPIIQSLYTETLSRKHSVPCGAVIVQEMNSIKQKSAAVYKETSTISKRPKKIPVNGEGSSRMPKPMNEHKNKSDPKRDLKRSCVYCLDEFFREPADAETPWPICPGCKKLDAFSRVKKLSEVFQHANQ
ncbi:putative transcription factor C2H2 family protein, partial [Tanacetum coccineum]